MKLDTALRTVAASSAAPIHATIVFCGAPALVRAASQLLLQRSPAATFRAEEVPPQTTEGNQAAAQEDAADRRSAFSVVDVFHRGIIRCVFVAPGCFEGGADSLIPDARASSPSLSCSVVAAFAHCAAPATAAKQVLVRELQLQQQQQQQHRDEDAVSAAAPTVTASLLSLDVFEAVCLAIDPLGNAASLSVAPLALPASFLRNAAGSESLFSSLFAAAVSTSSTTNVDHLSKQTSKNLPAVAIASGRNRPGRSEQLVQRALRAFAVIAAEARVTAQARAAAESGAAVAAPAAASVEKSWSEWTVRKLHDARGSSGVLAAFKTAATATESAVVAVPVPAEKQDERQASLTPAAVSAIAEALASLHARHAAATPAAFDHSLRQANVAFERKQNRLLLQQQQQQRQEQQAQQQQQRHDNDGGGDEEPLVAHEDVGSLSETDRILRALMAKRQSMSLARRAEEWIAQFSAQAVPAPLRALAVKLPHTWRFWLTPMGIIAMGTGLMMLVGVVLIFMS
jgi:hypothetical protein